MNTHGINIIYMVISNIKNKFKFFLKDLLDIDQSNWSLCFVRANLKEFIYNKNIKKKKIYFFKPPKTEFWADPFLFLYNNKKYVFFEKFLKKENKGIISVGLLRNNKLIKIKNIIKKKYHLSYPFIFRHNKNIFMIPESLEAKRMEIYKSIKFPYKWKLIKIHFEGEMVCDPTIFKHKGSLWLFLNKSKKKFTDLNKKLYLYKLSKNLSKITPHKLNPIKNSSFGGRSAGNILRVNKKIIRPAQIQQKNNYGYGLSFFQIIKLNLNQYKDKKISRIIPNIFNNAKGIHHITSIKNETIIDINLIN